MTVAGRGVPELMTRGTAYISLSRRARAPAAQRSRRILNLRPIGQVMQPDLNPAPLANSANDGIRCEQTKIEGFNHALVYKH
jgi:hypothetical protein